MDNYTILIKALQEKFRRQRKINDEDNFPYSPVQWDESAEPHAEVMDSAKTLDIIGKTSSWEEEPKIDQFTLWDSWASQNFSILNAGLFAHWLFSYGRDHWDDKKKQIGLDAYEIFQNNPLFRQGWARIHDSYVEYHKDSDRQAEDLAQYMQNILNMYQLKISAFDDPNAPIPGQLEFPPTSHKYIMHYKQYWEEPEEDEYPDFDPENVEKEMIPCDDPEELYNWDDPENPYSPVQYAANWIINEGLSENDGGECFYDPDGSYVENYSTGERVSESACLHGFTNQEVIAISDAVHRGFIINRNGKTADFGMTDFRGLDDENQPQDFNPKYDEDPLYQGVGPTALPYEELLKHLKNRRQKYFPDPDWGNTEYLINKDRNTYTSAWEEEPQDPGQYSLDAYDPQPGSYWWIQWRHTKKLLEIKDRLEDAYGLEYLTYRYPERMHSYYPYSLAEWKGMVDNGLVWPAQPPKMGGFDDPDSPNLNQLSLDYDLEDIGYWLFWLENFMMAYYNETGRKVFESYLDNGVFTLMDFFDEYCGYKGGTAFWEGQTKAQQELNKYGLWANPLLTPEQRHDGDLEGAKDTAISLYDWLVKAMKYYSGKTTTSSNINEIPVLPDRCDRCGRDMLGLECDNCGYKKDPVKPWDHWPEYDTKPTMYEEQYQSPYVSKIAELMNDWLEGADFQTEVLPNRVPFYLIPNGMYDVGKPGEQHYEMPERRWYLEKLREMGISDPEGAFQGLVIAHPQYGEFANWPYNPETGLEAEWITPEMKEKVLQSARAMFPKTSAWEQEEDKLIDTITPGSVWMIKWKDSTDYFVVDLDTGSAIWFTWLTGPNKGMQTHVAPHEWTRFYNYGELEPAENISRQLRLSYQPADNMSQNEYIWIDREDLGNRTDPQLALQRNEEKSKYKTFYSGGIWYIYDEQNHPIAEFDSEESAERYLINKNSAWEEENKTPKQFPLFDPNLPEIGSVWYFPKLRKYFTVKDVDLNGYQGIGEVILNGIVKIDGLTWKHGINNGMIEPVSKNSIWDPKEGAWENEEINPDQHELDWLPVLQNNSLGSGRFQFWIKLMGIAMFNDIGQAFYGQDEEGDTYIVNKGGGVWTMTPDGFCQRQEGYIPRFDSEKQYWFLQPMSKIADIENDVSDQVFRTDLHVWTDDHLPLLRQRENPQFKELQSYGDKVAFLYINGELFFDSSIQDIISRQLLHEPEDAYRGPSLAGTINLATGKIHYETGQNNQDPALREGFLHKLKQALLPNFSDTPYYPNDDIMHSDSEKYDISMH